MLLAISQGISGGERKRTSVGVELVVRPASKLYYLMHALYLDTLVSGVN